MPPQRSPHVHSDALQKDDTKQQLERMTSIQSARNSLIDLGVNPLVSLAPNLLDAVGEEEEQQVYPSADAGMLEQRAQPPSLKQPLEEVRL